MLDNYVFKYKNRKKFINKSGGIALGYKSYLEDFIKPIDTECKFVLWFSVDKVILKTSENVIFGIIYVPPESSNYSSVDAFSEIELEFQRLNKNSEFICLLGDMNAHISEFTDVTILDDMGLSRLRNSPDTVINSFGRKLISFCKDNNLFIFNGRVGKDKIGMSTSKNNSVIDYVVGTSLLLQIVHDFEIFEFNKLYSDVHSPLALTLRLNDSFSGKKSTNKKSFPRIKPWKQEKSELFKSNIDQEKLASLHSNLLDAISDTETVVKYDIDTFIQEVTSILLQSAEQTLGTQRPVIDTRNCQESKLWFNGDCKKSRRDYRKAKRLYKKYGSNLFKSRLKLTENAYKRTLDKNIINFNREMRIKMKKNEIKKSQRVLENF
ncbi:unnamed protein product [Mytilus edulis]|uniref:Endonuclease/exonuclease/phosphatase domain-containing protein n=1 Tax=Mytilus edulis TaxID=6550 RepID=A0A8S3T2H3_MYTED|nr:unnamed protein product [Mytilus edulis]